MNGGKNKVDLGDDNMLYKTDASINYYMNKHQSIDDFTFNSVIGKGTYAKVCLVTRISDGEVFALKVLKKKYIVEKNQEEHIMT